MHPKILWPESSALCTPFQPSMDALCHLEHFLWCGPWEKPVSGNLFPCPSNFFFLLWSTAQGQPKRSGEKTVSWSRLTSLRALCPLPPGRPTRVPSAWVPLGSFYDLRPPLLALECCSVIFPKALTCSGPALLKSKATFSLLTGLCASDRAG